MLLEFGVDTSEFSDAVMKDLPVIPYIITQEEISKRADLR